MAEAEQPQRPKLYGSQSSTAVDTAGRVYHREGAAIARAVAGGSAAVVRGLVDTAIAAQNDEIEVDVLVANASPEVRPLLEDLATKAVDRRSFIKGVVAGALGGVAEGVADGTITGWLFKTDEVDETTIVNEVIVEASEHGDVVSRTEGDAIWAEIRRLTEALERPEKRRSHGKDSGAH